MHSISAVDGTARIAAYGFNLDDQSAQVLDQELSLIESYGYTAGFVLVDMASGNVLASNADTVLYSASSVKAPYIMSLAASGTIDLDAVSVAADVQSQWDNTLINQILTVSDNDAYQQLRTSYGDDAFAWWAQQAGVTTDVTQDIYLNYTAEDLARLWVEGYGYLFLGEHGDTSAASPEARQWLADEMIGSIGSVTYQALGSSATVHSKAGYISGQGGLYALDDGAIVQSSSGDYVLAILSNAADEYDLLAGLVSTLDTIHATAM